MEQPISLENLSFEEVFGANDLSISNEESLWDKLIQQIIDGNVIPIIGADMLIDNRKNIHEVIIDGLAKSLNIQSNPKSFSELIYDHAYTQKFKKDNIYYQVNSLFANKRIPSAKRLERLLSIRQFPFVITTSFTPLVEQTMRSIWKDELRVMRFNNNPAENQDIKNSTDMSKPTVYYMFGRVGEGAHKYVLTDTDMLDYVAAWLSEDNKARPKKLCNELKDKYLLMLGNNYSDWLFRFIWYSMRKPKFEQSMLAYDDKLDSELINFLERTETFTKQNTSDVIDQIATRVERKLQEREETKFYKPEENADIFISYSRSDSAIAERLYIKLTEHGKRVWYDKNDITYGGNFMEEIRKAIRTTKYFIPIFTNNITLEKGQSHVYRNEWEQAIEVAISMGRTFIIPLAEEGFDFYRAAIPDRMQQHNAIYIPKDEDLDSVVEKIIHKMNQE